MPQFIFTMKDLRKVTPQGKEILRDIWLSFYGDAKIGVLGANGAGKSSLLRIMAGGGVRGGGGAVRGPAAARHGGRRQGLRGRGLRRRRHTRRLPDAGARARSQEER